MAWNAGKGENVLTKDPYFRHKNDEMHDILGFSTPKIISKFHSVQMDTRKQDAFGQPKRNWIFFRKVIKNKLPWKFSTTDTKTRPCLHSLASSVHVAGAWTRMRFDSRSFSRGAVENQREASPLAMRDGAMAGRRQQATLRKVQTECGGNNGDLIPSYNSKLVIRCQPL